MSGADAIIEVEKLSKVYGAVPALQGLNFSIQRGESVLLLGANGSGKSTLLRLLSGLSKPTSGSIRIGGWEMPREAMAVRAQIGLVAHRPLLYESLTARENLAFCGALYGIEAGERRRRIETLLRQVGLARRADSLVRTFSARDAAAFEHRSCSLASAGAATPGRALHGLGPSGGRIAGRSADFRPQRRTDCAHEYAPIGAQPGLCRARPDSFARHHPPRWTGFGRPERESTAKRPRSLPMKTPFVATVRAIVAKDLRGGNAFARGVERHGAFRPA